MRLTSAISESISGKSCAFIKDFGLILYFIKSCEICGSFVSIFRFLYFVFLNSILESFVDSFIESCGLDFITLLFS